jgi:hypothetical protein
MTDLERVRRKADSTAAHARTCKKSIDDCATCRDIVALYAGLPLDTLALVIEDRPIYKPAK